MLATLCFVLALVWFFAALGRGATPRAERLPWARWGARDLLANVALGVRQLVGLNERNGRMPDKRTYLNS